MTIDYKHDTLVSIPRDELQELSNRLISRVIDESMMTELFTFDSVQAEDQDSLLEAQFDSMLRMNAIALGLLPALFEDSNNEPQNVARMQRLLLWHFYAVSFKLESAVPLSTHCQCVESILKDSPKSTLEWLTSLTDLLHHYSKL